MKLETAIAASRGGAKNKLLGLAAVAAMAGAAAPAAAGTLLAQTTGANGNTYQLYSQSQGITWQQAEAAAIALGGHLVSIADADENALVYSLLGGNIEALYLNDGNRTGPFLGGFRATAGGAFAWSDGTAFSYTNWASGQPDNFGGQENYLQFFAGGGDPIDEPGEGAFWNDIGPNPANPNGLALGYFVEIAGNQPGAVPEPATWAMMIAGFGMVGTGLRRRRATTITYA